MLMREFMSLIPDILPCKYCRASFNKYSASLDITPFLESKEQLIIWLYKMHNKVNKKLRSQGFCHYENPTLEHVYSIYKPHIIKVNHLNESNTAKAMNYICNLGREFLGSIIFNYQGYFANCHTSEEKSKITVVYHNFFNILLPLMKRLLHLSSDYKSFKKFRIRGMLQQNESYSRLKRWFFECDSLCTFDASYSYNDYETEFNKHSVAGCDNPKADNVKSCRKVSHKKTRKRKLY
jgi:hypothetical protein